MARIRTIKPEFFLDDEIAELDPRCRLLFIGLWCLADKAGRLEDKPKKIKIQILPYDNYDIDKALVELHSRGFIIRYAVENKNLIQIRTFDKHQKVHHTEKESIIPPYNGEITVKEPLNNGEEPVPSPVGKERKGKERNIYIPQKKSAPKKNLHMESVYLTDDEYQKLVSKYGRDPTTKAIEILNNAIMSKGYKYKSHYHTLIGWPMTRAREGGNGNGITSQYGNRRPISTGTLPPDEFYDRLNAQGDALEKALANGPDSKGHPGH